MIPRREGRLTRLVEEALDEAYWFGALALAVGLVTYAVVQFVRVVFT